MQKTTSLVYLMQKPSNISKLYHILDKEAKH